MPLKIAIILYVLCHPAFCNIMGRNIRQPMGTEESELPEKYIDSRTIISRIQGDTKDCLMVDPNLFAQCDRPEHTFNSKEYFVDFDMVLCMSSYDAALRICKINDKGVLKNLQEAMEQEKEKTINSTVFCNRMNSVLVESSFPQTKKWVSLLKKQFSNEDSCKRECIQDDIKNPLCKFLFFANLLSLQFEKDKLSSSAISTDKAVSANQKIPPNFIPDALQSHHIKFGTGNANKADHVSPVNNTHAQVTALLSSQKAETGTSDVDPVVKNKNSDTQSSVLTDKKINQKNLEQDQSLKKINQKNLEQDQSLKKVNQKKLEQDQSLRKVNQKNLEQDQSLKVNTITGSPVEGSKVTTTIKPDLVGQLNVNNVPQNENEATKEAPSVNRKMQQTSNNDKKQEPVPQNTNRSQTSTTQNMTTVASQLNETDKSKLESVISLTSSTELPKPEKGDVVPTKSKPIDVDISKTQGTDDEDGPLLYGPGQDAAVESSIAESPTESSEMQDTDAGVAFDDEDQDLAQHDADTTDAELGKDKGPIGGSDSNMVFSDQFVNAEDSHFFAYFMTMVVLCIIGYLVFHNKQKILALALEGRARRGTRRRPNTSGYRKLDSNLEEAVTSACSTSVTHVIY